jgi:hypothetical protein
MTSLGDGHEVSEIREAERTPNRASEIVPRTLTIDPSRTLDTVTLALRTQLTSSLAAGGCTMSEESVGECLDALVNEAYATQGSNDDAGFDRLTRSLATVVGAMDLLEQASNEAVG